MLSYRHAFHAGNLADVFKHLMLHLTLTAMTRKDTPLCYLETHAGSGLYDLRGPLAKKRAEYQGGIDQLLPKAAGSNAPALLTDLLDLFAETRDQNHYPGSVFVARRVLRNSDRMVMAELHPGDYAQLAAQFSSWPNTSVSGGDGYALLRATLPPKERRGMVLIDPSYELDQEPIAVVKALRDALRRFGHGVYMVWYPLRGKLDAQALARRVCALAPGKVLRAEVTLLGGDDVPGRLPSGVIIINPPYLLDQQADEALRWLCTVLPDITYRIEAA